MSDPNSPAIPDIKGLAQQVLEDATAYENGLNKAAADQASLAAIQTTVAQDANETMSQRQTLVDRISALQAAIVTGP